MVFELRSLWVGKYSIRKVVSRIAKAFGFMGFPFEE